MSAVAAAKMWHGEVGHNNWAPLAPLFAPCGFSPSSDSRRGYRLKSPPPALASGSPEDCPLGSLLQCARTLLWGSLAPARKEEGLGLSLR